MPDATQVTFAYDADGQRVSQTADGQSTDYLWDKYSAYGDVVLETGAAGAVSYTLANGQLLSQTRDGVPSYYLNDGQGSIRAIADASGVVTDTYDYTAFGEIYSQSGSSENSYLYTGQQFDEATGLYDLRARYYAPGLGRFLSQDMAGVLYNNPAELNRYVYTANNPINLSDPSGLMAETAIINSRVGLQASPPVAALGQFVGSRIAVPALALILLAVASQQVDETIEILVGSGLFGGREIVVGSEPPGQGPDGNELLKALIKWLKKLPQYIGRWVINTTIAALERIAGAIVLAAGLQWAAEDRAEQSGGETPASTDTETCEEGDTECKKSRENHLVMGFANDPATGDRIFDDFFSNIRITYGGRANAISGAEWSNLIRNIASGDTAMHTAYRIHFNLEGALHLAPTYSLFAAKYGNGGIYPLGSHPEHFRDTAWELWHVRDKFCTKTYFYEHGSTNPTPSLSAGQQICDPLYMLPN